MSRYFSARTIQMKFRAIAWVAAAVFLPSAHALDYSWDNHGDTETFVRNVGKSVTFMDDARYILTPLQSGTTGVKATFALTRGTIGSLKVDFYGDYYGPDKYLGSFVGDLSKGPLTFSFEHIEGRKKYYYLITGTTGASGAGYTLTSNLVADSALGHVAAPVPEPASYAMFALGAALLPLARRMRQRRSAK
ncbi:PEP-CTERM sorting domain-containing protein [Azohydromonas caseinilytica]|uniref:PEP-CTERM sorting domain-containing protein n=1 Tax=Azohydromonas caseinilytica TaxID=2728836 RepID=A0A848FGT6_9BURK|nr:PEP-CTERM sorting domain-containing protein [Azohydromonas caseinilytica]NML17509.1 PEP-CTERM sorting domain-containing protein [Azohydromonas caseinilytica]